MSMIVKQIKEMSKNATNSYVLIFFSMIKNVTEKKYTERWLYLKKPIALWLIDKPCNIGSEALCPVY